MTIDAAKKDATGDEFAYLLSTVPGRDTCAAKRRKKLAARV